jgi:hypothetical protein
LQQAAQRTTYQWGSNEQPKLRQCSAPTNNAGPMDRAGFTDVPVTEMPTK